MKAKLIALLFAFCLTACDRGPQPVKADMGIASQLSSDSSRIAVTQLAEFHDDLAYGDRRGIYLIRDKQTGQEFIGISGIGISELGSHPSGKTTVNDER